MQLTFLQLVLKQQAVRCVINYLYTSSGAVHIHELGLTTGPKTPKRSQESLGAARKYLHFF